MEKWKSTLKHKRRPIGLVLFLVSLFLLLVLLDYGSLWYRGRVVQQTPMMSVIPQGYHTITISSLTDAILAKLQQGDQGVRLIEQTGGNTALVSSQGTGRPSYIDSFTTKSAPQKIPPNLQQLSQNDLLLNTPESSTTQECGIEMTSYDSRLDLSSVLNALGFTTVQKTGKYYTALLTPCDAQQIKKNIITLSNRNDVEWAYPLYQPTESLNVVRSLTKTDTIHAVLGYEGSGTTAGIWDVGRCSDPAALPYNHCHQDFCSRVKKGDNGRIASNRIFYKENHPTMVTGTLLGDGGSSNGVYKGMAPKAQAICYNSLFADGEMIFAGQQNLIDVASNSWSMCDSASCVSMVIAINTRANDVAQQIPDIPIVFAAGNEAGGGQYIGCNLEGYLLNVPNAKDYYCIGPIASAKNILTIGATDKFTGKITSYSSRGPGWDGRIKPDIVAPSGDTLSIMTTDLNDQYGLFAGTSESTPVVSGHILLLKEAFKNSPLKQYSQSYETAFMKALLIHTAQDKGLAGPDYMYGYGEIQPKAAHDRLAKQQGIYFLSFDKYTKGITQKIPVAFDPTTTQQLTVTMVYLDTPGVPQWAPITNMQSRTEMANLLDLSIGDINCISIKQPFILDVTQPWKAAATGFAKDTVQQVIVTPAELAPYVNQKYVNVCVNFRTVVNPDQKYVLIIGDGDTNSGYQPTCGNGQLDVPGEECDLNRLGIPDFGGKTCANYGGQVGMGQLVCTPTCSVDPYQCAAPFCGDGQLGLGEMCDPNAGTATCALGCFEQKEGAGKACKCMCTNDLDCQGPGRGLIRCEDGICQGCGDGEFDVNEECDDSSTSSASTACTKKYGSSSIPYSCYNCGCMAGGELLSTGTFNTAYICKGKTVLSKPQCQTDAECGNGYICNDGCNCESGWRCPVSGQKITYVPKCTKDGDCNPGETCTGQCVCVMQTKYLCRGKNIHPQIAQCQNDTECPGYPAQYCDATCQCMNKPVCGDGVINQPGEECEPPGSQCTTCQSGSGTCQQDCTCLDNCGISY